LVKPRKNPAVLELAAVLVRYEASRRENSKVPIKAVPPRNRPATGHARRAAAWKNHGGREKLNRPLKPVPYRKGCR